MAIAGVRPRPAGKTRDGYCSSVFVDYLENADQQFEVGSQKLDGVDSWEMDCHHPMVVISSEKTCYPAGKAVTDFTEVVDIAPTILAPVGADLSNAEYDYLDGYNLARIAASELPAHDYLIGECHAVTGHRAYIRTPDYVFSMQSCANKQRGKNMRSALLTAPRRISHRRNRFSAGDSELRR